MREAQIARINRVKADRDEAACEASLDALRAAAAGPQNIENNLLAHAVEAARARVQAAQLDAGRAEIRAPISAVVANRVVSEGQLLSPGQQALSIVPVDQAYVIANFKETQVENMRPGQKVELKVDAYPHLKVEGTVLSLAPASGAQFSLIPQDTATGNFTKIVQRVPVRLAISKEALDTGLMRPGLSVEAVVNIKPAKS